MKADMMKCIKNSFNNMIRYSEISRKKESSNKFLKVNQLGKNSTYYTSQ